MQTEDLVIDQGGQGEEIEEVREVLPHVGVAVFAEAFIVEAVDLGDLARLVVSSKDSNALRVTDLEGDKESDGLHGIITSINVIACRANQLEFQRSREITTTYP